MSHSSVARAKLLDTSRLGEHIPSGQSVSHEETPMTLNPKVQLGSLLSAATLACALVLLSTEGAEALKACTAGQCGIGPVRKCHTVMSTCPQPHGGYGGGHHPPYCHPQPITLCN